jgi:ribosomal protein S18 acetylase RimI-like enzyme
MRERWARCSSLMWSTSLLTDRDRALAYLRSDEVYAAYAIGDLEPEMFALSSFAGAERDGRLQSLVLHFRGLEVPALFLMGDPEGVRAVLADELRPERVYLTLREKHESAARAFYRWEQTVPMWRMALCPGSFRGADGDCLRLDAQHVGQLLNLYALGGADAFSPSQVDHGVFYGIMGGKSLVAAAGTHLVSRSYGVAAVGNVFVHPEHRKRGLGSAVTGAVVAELLRLGAHLVILNVAQDNGPAIRMYERMGFERSCPFLECPVAVATT